ncbi:hypothetical protein DMW43_15945 [Serratia marcescens]|nr:hypothetical protein DMW43_15945 [Serratia marcescens]PYA48659.1 hypothetical protein DMW45_10795 [Serratia marcescens]
MGWGKKKVAAERAAIPDEILASIEGAQFYTRNGDNDAPRIIVQPEGFGGFIFSDDSVDKWLKRAFPELTPRQMERAANYLASLVRSHFRESRRSQEKAKNWVNGW